MSQVPTEARGPSFGLLPHHAAMLRASAIDPVVAQARGYRSIEKKVDVRGLGFAANQCRVPGLLMAIHDFQGEVAGYQYRPDAPRIRDGKPVKYETPRGASLAVDVPPAARPYLRNPDVPLVITEGLKKADAAVSHGLCCVALLGVWNWRGGNEYGGLTTLPDLDEIAWKAAGGTPRDVFICFDSDVALKRGVRLAMERLAGVLNTRGAGVRFVCLPMGEAGAKVGLDDFLASGHTAQELLALASDELRQARDPEEEAEEAARHPYRETARGLVWDKRTSAGTEEVRLANFTARIVADELEDDGVETRRTFALASRLNDREHAFTVPAAGFGSVNWVTEKLGAGAVVEPGFAVKDRLRAAIQSLSTGVEERRVYTHLGWRRIGDGWVYLHAGGGIGPDGPIGPETLRTRPHDALRAYCLPPPPDGEELAAAVRASLRMLELGPPEVVAPVGALLWRSLLGPADFSLHLSGETGVFKTELAALAQQHFGAGMDARNLPASWSATENFLEGLAFLAKDTLLVIDEFKPRGGTAEVQRWQAKADRVLRAQGNRSGRGRMRADGSIPAPHPPRGTILSTGEEAPTGQSLNARVLVLDLGPGDIRPVPLSRCQADAASGLYAQATAGFARWLAARYDETIGLRADRVRRLRDEMAQGHRHRRTPGIVADLLDASSLFLRFAEEVGAVTPEEASRWYERVKAGILTAAEAQAQHQRDADPAHRYVQLLVQAMASGRAHLTGLDGAEPNNAAAWGWREETLGTGGFQRTAREPQGERVGWTDGANVWLIPDAAYQCAKRLGGETGEGVTVGIKALHKQLAGKGLLATVGGKRGATVRKTIADERHEVLHLLAGALYREGTAQSAQSALHLSDSTLTSAAGDGTGQFPWADSLESSPITAHEICPDDPPHTLSGNGTGPIGQIGQEPQPIRVAAEREEWLP